MTPPPAPTPAGEWTQMVLPIAERLALAGKLQMEFVHPPEGAAALAALLLAMAERLDRALAGVVDG